MVVSSSKTQVGHAELNRQRSPRVTTPLRGEASSCEVKLSVAAGRAGPRGCAELAVILQSYDADMYTCTGSEFDFTSGGGV